jgi:predicted enzyme related to lactoylglutathione lyase
MVRAGSAGCLCCSFSQPPRFFTTDKKMKLNHIDIHVPDVDETSKFFIDNFGMRLEAMRATTSPFYATTTILSLSSATRSKKLWSRPNCHWRRDLPSRFHRSDTCEVDAVYARIRANSADVPPRPSAIWGGWVFYCRAPGQILIEVSPVPGVDRLPVRLGRSSSRTTFFFADAALRQILRGSCAASCAWPICIVATRKRDDFHGLRVDGSGLSAY